MEDYVIQEFFGTILVYLMFYPSAMMGLSTPKLWVLQYFMLVGLDTITAGSGFNPSFNFAFYLSGDMPKRIALLRSGAAVAGAVVALPVVNWCLPNALGGKPLDLGDPDVHQWEGMFAKEFASSALLVLAILHMSKFGEKYGIYFLGFVFRFILYFWKDPCMNPIFALSFYLYNGKFHTLDVPTAKFFLMVYIVAPTLAACSVTMTVKHVVDTKISSSTAKQKEE